MNRNEVMNLGITHLARHGVHIEEIDYFLDRLEQYDHNTHEEIDREDIRNRLIRYFGLTRTKRIDEGGLI